MKFSLAVLAVLARIRLLVQQMLLDAVILYNTVSSLSQKEQSIKLNQEGFEVFREYYPRKEEDRILLECIWLKDKFVLVVKTHKSETTSQDKVDGEDVLSSAPQILYDNIEVLLGVTESGATSSEDPAANTMDVPENCSDAGLKKDDNLSDIARSSSENAVSLGDMFTYPSAGMISETKLVRDDLCSVITSDDRGAHLEAGSSNISIKKETKKKVVFVAIKPPAPSTASRSKSHLQGAEMDQKKDPFFSLLTGGNNTSVL